jgi:hypothetical protein
MFMQEHSLQSNCTTVTNTSNGYLYVASNQKGYLRSAIYSALSLKDYHPSANTTLATEKKWITDDLYDVFDNVIEVSDHYRAKLEALPQTPYDLTLYIDADTEIRHEDISKVFDQMTDTADIMLTKTRDYASAEVYFPGGELRDHCGVFLYKKTPKVITFMEKWFEYYKKQKDFGEHNWPYDRNLYPSSLRFWDQFTFWWLQNKTEYAIVREYFQDPDARWNFVWPYEQEGRHECDRDDIVIYHRTLSDKMKGSR